MKVGMWKLPPGVIGTALGLSDWSTIGLAVALAFLFAGPGTEAKLFATALGGGILLDATLIRGVLAPAVVALLGRWNWWLPRRAARVLRVRPSKGRLEVAPEPSPVSA